MTRHLHPTESKRSARRPVGRTCPGHRWNQQRAFAVQNPGSGPLI